MLGHGAIGQFAIGDVGVQNQTILVSQWFANLTEPVRVKPLLQTGLQSAEHFDPNPFPPIWFFEWLSEPVRLKPGLRSQLQKVTEQDTLFIPDKTDLLNMWFQWMAEPKRFPKGLAVQLQSDYTAHPRVLPKPNVTATLNTTENDQDKYTIVVNVIQSKPTATAQVSVSEIISRAGGTGGSATSVIES